MYDTKLEVTVKNKLNERSHLVWHIEAVNKNGEELQKIMLQQMI